MKPSKIQRDITIFEKKLAEAQWNDSYLLFYLPFIGIFACLSIVFIGIILDEIIGINILKYIPPLKLSFLLSFLYLAYWAGKGAYDIQKDLKAKSYIPVIARVHTLCIQTITMEEGGTRPNYYAILVIANQATEIHQSNFEKKSKITLLIQEKTYEQLKEKEYYFFLVGKHSDYWYCTDPRFKKEGLERGFFS